MRIRLTFSSIEQGVAPPLVKQERFPSLEFLLSPECNLFYETAVNLKQQSMKIQGYEAETRRFDAAATAAERPRKYPRLKQKKK